MLSAFVIEKRCPASASANGWVFVYCGDKESKVRAQFLKSRAILPPGWHLRLRHGATVLEDYTRLDPPSASVSAVQAVNAPGPTGHGYQGDDVDAIPIPGPWIEDNWIYPDVFD